MPRRGPAQGYDAAPVCAFCFEMLNGMCSPVYHTPKLYSTVLLYFPGLLSCPVTALGRAQLRSLPLGRLRRYIDAYNIQIKNPIDKNDLVDAAMAVRVGRGISHHVK